MLSIALISTRGILAGGMDSFVPFVAIFKG
ncbi:hypothetical protein OPIT5_18425 [Opitutaceae bacterium TAV5]|nr:hypothetical protein OPIT5_18425 [Opitutaceae bacterium TAV5]